MYKQILILEDNLHSMNMVCNIVKDIDNVILFKAESSDKAYKYALENNIGLFVVDLVLNTKTVGDVSGVKFIEQIRSIERYKFVPVIVTTSLIDQHFMIYAHFHCFRYFEKPYNKKEFKEAVVEALNYETAKTERKYYPYKSDGVLYHIKIADIVYSENKNLTTYINCRDKSIIETPYKSCKNMLLELHSDKFLKCNNKTVVNIEYIQYVDPVNRYIQLIDNLGVIEIGAKIKKTFLDGYTKC